MKSYSDLQQSKKLAEILPLESADMYYPIEGASPKFGVALSISSNIPCWSLAALLEQLPYEVCDNDGNSLYLEINKEDDVYQLAYIDPYGFTENIYPDMHEHFVDACVAMVEKLKELNLL